MREIVVGEAAAGLVEVVIEAVVDGGADGDLRAGEEALHGVGHDVRGRVADDREALGVRGLDGGECERGVDGGVEIDDLSVRSNRDDVVAELALRGEQIARGLLFVGL